MSDPYFTEFGSRIRRAADSVSIPIPFNADGIVELLNVAWKEGYKEGLAKCQPVVKREGDGQ